MTQIFRVVLWCNLLLGLLGFVAFCTGTKQVLSLPFLILLGLGGAGIVILYAVPNKSLLPITAKYLLPISLIYAFWRFAQTQPMTLACQDFTLLAAFGVSFSSVLLNASKKTKQAIYFILAIAITGHLTAALWQGLKDPTFFPLPGYKRQGYSMMTTQSEVGNSPFQLINVRVGGGFNNPNHFGFFVGVIIIWLLSYSIEYKQKNIGKTALWGLILILFITLFETGSRGALLAFLGSLLVMVAFLYRKKNIKYPKYFFPCCLIIFLIVFSGYVKLALAKRFGSSALLTSGAVERERLRNVAWQQYLVAPIFGTGSGTFTRFENIFRSIKWVETQPSKSPETAHCDIIQLLSEHGLIGGTLLLIFIGYIAIPAKKVIFCKDAKTYHEISTFTNSGLGIISILLCLLVHSWIDFPLRSPANVVLLSIALGMYSGSQLNKNNLRRSRLISVSSKLSMLVLSVSAVFFGTIRLRSTVYEEMGLLLENRNPLRAISYYHKATKVEPTHFKLAWKLGAICYKLALKNQNNPTVSASYFEKSLKNFINSCKLYPESLMTNYSIGIALNQVRHFEEVDVFLRRCILLAPNHSGVRGDYALHRHAVSMYRSGISTKQEALRLYQTFEDDFPNQDSRIMVKMMQLQQHLAENSNIEDSRKTD